MEERIAEASRSGRVSAGGDKPVGFLVEGVRGRGSGAWTLREHKHRVRCHVWLAANGSSPKAENGEEKVNYLSSGIRQGQLQFIQTTAVPDRRGTDTC